jgi:hypothetical protein
MSHKAEITGEEKTDVAVKIFYEVTVDGSVDGVPSELDGEKLTGHFDIDYRRYQDNENVRRSLCDWADEKVQARVEEYSSSETAQGLQVEI